MAAETIVITSPTAQAYAELQAAFDHYNRELFGGELPPCLITMQREKRTYGYFSSERFVHRHDRRRIGRTSCVFRRVRDTAKSDKGASVKFWAARKGAGQARKGFSDARR